METECSLSCSWELINPISNQTNSAMTSPYLIYLRSILSPHLRLVFETISSLRVFNWSSVMYFSRVLCVSSMSSFDTIAKTLFCENELMNFLMYLNAESYYMHNLFGPFEHSDYISPALTLQNCTLSSVFSLLYFERIKGGVWYHFAVCCVYVYHPPSTHESRSGAKRDGS
jgi:hypothetical protein